MEIGREEFDRFQAEIASFRQDVKAGFGVMTQLVGETNTRLAGVENEVGGLKQEVGGLKQELVEFKQEVSDFKTQVSSKLDGIGSFLVASENARQTLDVRVTKLEKRVDRLEDKGPAA